MLKKVKILWILKLKKKMRGKNSRISNRLSLESYDILVYIQKNYINKYKSLNKIEKNVSVFLRVSVLTLNI